MTRPRNEWHVSVKLSSVVGRGGGWRRRRQQQPAKKKCCSQSLELRGGGRGKGASEQLLGFSLVQPTTHHTGEPMTRPLQGCEGFL